MKRLAVVVDSSSNIKTGQISNCFVVPLSLSCQTAQTIEDLSSCSHQEIIARLQQQQTITTSQINYGVALKQLKAIIDQYDHIIILPISSAISGTFKTWQLILKDDVVDPKINLWDLGTIGLTTSALVEQIFEWWNHEQAIEKIYQKSLAYTKKVAYCLILNNVQTLVKGGRLSSLKANIIKWLHLKIALSYKDGKMDMLDKKQSLDQLFKKAVAYLSQEIQFQTRGLAEVYIMHSYAQHTEVEWVVKQIQQQLGQNNWQLKVDYLPKTIIAHVDFNCLGICFVSQ